MRNREEKKRAMRTQRASAAGPRAHRARARDHVRSRPLRIVFACTIVIIISIMAVLPTFGASSGFKGEDTYISGSNIQTVEYIGAYNKYDMPYQTSIVGNDPSFFGKPQETITSVFSNSIIINTKIVFDNTLWPTFEGDGPWEITIPMYNFYPYTPLGEGASNGIAKAIRFILGERNDTHLYYITLDGTLTNVYNGTYTLENGIYKAYGEWVSDGYRTIYPSGGTGETPWTASDDGITYYNFLRSNATFTTYAGNGSATNKTDSPFRRTINSTTTAWQEAENQLKGETKYTIKAWWQANAQPLSIRFYGQNVVIDEWQNHKYPTFAEIPDVSTYAPTLTYKVRYTYFFNESITDQRDEYVVYTGEKTFSTPILSQEMPLMPDAEQIFGTEAIERVGGIIYDEWETTITFDHAMQNNFDLTIYDYYYTGEARRQHEVAGYFDAFRRDFNTPLPVEFQNIGGFLTNAIGGFFDTPLFGVFSIGDILLTIIGIGLVIVFIKMFAGG